MNTEKRLTLAVLIVAGLVALLFVLDLALAIPFGRQIVMDILFLIVAAFLIWQGVETYREFS